MASLNDATVKEPVKDLNRYIIGSIVLNFTISNAKNALATTTL